MAAAERLRSGGARWVVVKGGHLAGSADDVVAGPDGTRVLRAERVGTRNDHGTGCSLSAAVAAQLARGATVPEALGAAKAFVRPGPGRRRAAGAWVQATAPSTTSDGRRGRRLDGPWRPRERRRPHAPREARSRPHCGPRRRAACRSAPPWWSSGWPCSFSGSSCPWAWSTSTRVAPVRTVAKPEHGSREPAARRPGRGHARPDRRRRPTALGRPERRLPPERVGPGLFARTTPPQPACTTSR